MTGIETGIEIQCNCCQIPMILFSEPKKKNLKIYVKEKLNYLKEKSVLHTSR